MKKRLLSCFLVLILCLGMGTTAFAETSPEVSGIAVAGKTAVTVKLSNMETDHYFFGMVWKDKEILCFFDGVTDAAGSQTMEVEIGRSIQVDDVLRVGVSIEDDAWSAPVKVENAASPVQPDPKPTPGGGGGGGAGGGTSTPVVKPDEDVSKAVFNDVKDSDYFAAPVHWALEREITSGVEEGRFGPELPCTRGQILTFLWRAAGSPQPKSLAAAFQDVAEEDYFFKAVCWAVEQGITGGTGPNVFSPDMTCTRAQAVTMLYRAAGAGTTAGTTFSDVTPDDYFAAAVQWAVDREITSGVGEGRFGPEQPCTRGQIITFLWRQFDRT